LSFLGIGFRGYKYFSVSVFFSIYGITISHELAFARHLHLQVHPQSMYT